MQGKILIVDAIATNRIVLKVKLKSAFYDVLYAQTIAEALQQAQTFSPDLIIAAMDLPDGSAASLHDALKMRPDTQSIPLMAVASQINHDDRMTALAAGVRDVLTRPLDETFLLGRVRSLIRAHATVAEWQLREDTGRALGLAEADRSFVKQAHCMLISSDKMLLQNYATQLRPDLRMQLSLACPSTLMAELRARQCPDIFVFVLPEHGTAAMETLRLVSALRANSGTRHTGIMVLQTKADSALAVTALDMGADDLLADGFDAEELKLRLAGLLHRLRTAERLRCSIRTGLKAAVCDPLTGLYNRRYAMPHLARIADHASKTGHSFAVLVADLDHFKQVNDHFGHAAGDAVLTEVADRLRKCLRNNDLAARIGGEEFLIVMPNAPRLHAQRAALRICEAISGAPFVIPGSDAPLQVTISIGMTVNEDGKLTLQPDAMLQTADKALYAAKGGGRNQVTLARPAA